MSSCPNSDLGNPSPFLSGDGDHESNLFKTMPGQRVAPDLPPSAQIRGQKVRRSLFTNQPRGSDLPFFDGLLGRPQKRRIPSFLEKMEDLVLCDKSSVFGATCLHSHKTAGNWKPETGNRKPETGNQKPESGNGNRNWNQNWNRNLKREPEPKPKPETGNQKPESGNGNRNWNQNWNRNLKREPELFGRGADGKTPWERETGRKWSRPTPEFGERVFVREAMERINRRRQNGEPRAIEVWYAGHHARTGAVIGLNLAGVQVGKCPRRCPVDMRWSMDGWCELARLAVGASSEKQKDARQSCG